MWQLLQPMIFFLVALASVAGLWALSAPQSFIRLNRLCSTWIETRGLEQKLSESRHSLDRLIYRHHFLSGFLLMVSSLSLLYLVLFHFAGQAAKPGPGMVSTEWWNLLYEFMLSFACLAGITGMIVGMIVFIRPSSLKLVESWGNRAVSVQPYFERLERRFVAIDDWVERHTRLFGCVVLLLSLFIGFLIWEVMRRNG
jgi:hypothetical protein